MDFKFEVRKITPSEFIARAGIRCTQKWAAPTNGEWGSSPVVVRITLHRTMGEQEQSYPVDYFSSSVLQTDEQFTYSPILQ